MEVLKPQLIEVKMSPGETDPAGVCEECARKNKQNKQFFRETAFEKLPQVLLLSISRWTQQQGKTKKDTSRVVLNKHLSLKDSKYSLAGWVSHKGSPYSGHNYMVHFKKGISVTLNNNVAPKVNIEIH